MFKLLFLSFLYFSTSLLAVVYVAPNEVGLRPGLSGNIQASVSNQRGNTHKNEYDFSSQISYDNNSSYVTWLNFSYNYGDVQGVENENKAYAHYRFLHTLYSDNWNWELFVQNQGDDFRKIQRRLLGGGGIRWRFYHGDRFGRIYFGLGAYYEYLDYTTAVDPQEHNKRVNSYLAYTKKFGKDARVSFESYYQPKADNWSDYYSLQAASLLFYLYGSIYVKFSVSYQYDSIPAIGVNHNDFQHLSSVGWKFGAKSNR